MAAGTVVDLGDAVANGIAAIAVVISVIALFTADSRAKQANEIALDANETSREARDIAEAANDIARNQHVYAVSKDQQREQIQFRTEAVELKTAVHYFTQTRVDMYRVTHRRSPGYLREKAMEVEPRFPEIHLNNFRELIIVIMSTARMHGVAQQFGRSPDSFDKAKVYQYLIDNWYEDYKRVMRLARGVFDRAYRGEYFLLEFEEPNIELTNAHQELKSKFEAIEALYK